MGCGGAWRRCARPSPQGGTRDYVGAPEGAKPRVQGKPRELRPQNGPERLPRPPQHPRCTTRPLVRTLATQVFIPVGCVIVAARVPLYASARVAAYLGLRFIRAK